MYILARLEKQQASFGNLGAKFRALLRPPGTSQHYRMEGFKGDPQLGPHYVIYTSLVYWPSNLKPITVSNDKMFSINCREETSHRYTKLVHTSD